MKEAYATETLLRYWTGWGDEKLTAPEIFQVDSSNLPPVMVCMSFFLMHSGSQPDALAALTWVYIDRFLEKSRMPINETTMHMVVLVCLVLAHLWLEDQSFTLKVYASLGGVSVNTLKALQLYVCYQLDWCLHVTPLSFEQYRLSLQCCICDSLACV